MADCSPYRLAGHPFPSQLCSHLFCDIAIGEHLAIGDFPQNAPHALAESTADGASGNSETEGFSPEKYCSSHFFAAVNTGRSSFGAIASGMAPP